MIIQPPPPSKVNTIFYPSFIPPNKEPKNKIKINERIKKLLTDLGSGLYEKDKPLRLSVLSLVAKENIFFLGPAGVAKSMIGRRVKLLLKDLKQDKEEPSGYFEYLMNEFSTPDEICGPISLKALNEDRYERIVKGYLPTAKIAFLDEIWKSGPAILNTLLTIINEKLFHNGKEKTPCLLISLIAASNELPEKDRGLEALWDRFVIRLAVTPIEDEDAFIDFLKQKNNLPEPRIDESLAFTSTEIEEWQEEIDKVSIEKIEDVIIAIRQELKRRNDKLKKKDDEGDRYYISDRRWKKIIHIIKTCAFLNGREECDLMDLSLIEDCLWSNDKQRVEVKEIVFNLLKENGLECEDNCAEIEEKIKEFGEQADKVNKEMYNYTYPLIKNSTIKTLNNDYYSSILKAIEDELERLKGIKTESEEPYSSNLFADKEYCTSLMQKMEEAINTLETKKLALEKIRNIYK